MLDDSGNSSTHSRIMWGSTPLYSKKKSGRRLVMMLSMASEREPKKHNTMMAVHFLLVERLRGSIEDV